MLQSCANLGEVRYVSTGLPQLDRICGGIPKKKIVEISGPWSSGKTTLAFHIVKEAQGAGMPVLWADVEMTLDGSMQQAERIGVDIGVDSSLQVLQERYAEAYVDEMVRYAESIKNALIVVDSIGALSSQKEAEKNADARAIGVQANLVSRFVRSIFPIIHLKDSILLVLNHQVMNIMTGTLKTSGGAKLEYHKSLQISLKKTGRRILQGERQIGEVIQARIAKNKTGTPKGQCDLHLFYGQGFSAESDILQLALDKGVITKEGNTYYFQGEKIAVGMPKLREALKNDELLQTIKAEL